MCNEPPFIRIVLHSELLVFFFVIHCVCFDSKVFHLPPFVFARLSPLQEVILISLANALTAPPAASAATDSYWMCYLCLLP